MTQVVTGLGAVSDVDAGAAQMDVEATEPVLAGSTGRRNLYRQVIALVGPVTG